MSIQKGLDILPNRRNNIVHHENNVNAPSLHVSLDCQNDIVSGNNSPVRALWTKHIEAEHLLYPPGKNGVITGKHSHMCSKDRAIQKITHSIKKIRPKGNTEKYQGAGRDFVLTKKDEEKKLCDNKEYKF